MKHEGKKTILLVEDQVLIATSKKIEMEQLGYNVVIADSGRKAVELVTGKPSFDLILMDINLGIGLDGTEAAKTMIREYEIPIIFLSSRMEIRLGA
jgi:CheY-like chemotaxis protein